MSMILATDKYCVILGLGVTGLSVARYFQRRGIAFCVVDTREHPPGAEELQSLAPRARTFFGSVTSQTEETLLQASEIVISPGVDRRERFVKTALQAGVSVVGDIELFIRDVAVPVVGITGSNGKTTVATLLGEVATAAGLKACVAGNIGFAALDALEEQAELYILELSSFQLESINTARFAVACILNVTEDHMDRYDAFPDYWKAKQRIYRGAKAVVYNLDDTLSQPPVAEGVPRSGFALQAVNEKNERQYIYKADDSELCCEGQLLQHSGEFKLVGSHNVANILAVYAIADFLDIERTITASAVAGFKGLAHRCEWVDAIGQVIFVNDSKATNVGATLSAIRGLKNTYSMLVLIVGGEGKDANFSELQGLISQEVDCLIAIGRDGRLIADKVSENVRKIFSDSMEEAVTAAYQTAKAGSLVLLSPACASFDMFSGYEERGNSFKKAVRALTA